MSIYRTPSHLAVLSNEVPESWFCHVVNFFSLAEIQVSKPGGLHYKYYSACIKSCPYASPVFHRTWENTKEGFKWILLYFSTPMRCLATFHFIYIYIYNPPVTTNKLYCMQLFQHAVCNNSFDKIDTASLCPVARSLQPVQIQFKKTEKACMFFPLQEQRDLVTFSPTRADFRAIFYTHFFLIIKYIIPTRIACTLQFGMNEWQFPDTIFFQYNQYLFCNKPSPIWYLNLY
jgi:hypothetical protein